METQRGKTTYAAPRLEVFSFEMTTEILSFSSRGVGLEGAGVDEGQANENGSNIW